MNTDIVSCRTVASGPLPWAGSEPSLLRNIGNIDATKPATVEVRSMARDTTRAIFKSFQKMMLTFC